MIQRKRRGFASMSDERQREIASKGGRAAHAQGRAHQFSADEARVAGKKGGRAVREKYGPEFYANIGRIGGGRRGQRARPPVVTPVSNTAPAMPSFSTAEPSSAATA
ncbi:MAG: general stress protein [Chloroflexi bacterium]|nr:general stress protein [Chloroflexota bacterium]